jgi:hypothetical protein
VIGKEDGVQSLFRAIEVELKNRQLLS